MAKFGQTEEDIRKSRRRRRVAAKFIRIYALIILGFWVWFFLWDLAFCSAGFGKGMIADRFCPEPLGFSWQAIQAAAWAATYFAIPFFLIMTVWIVIEYRRQERAERNELG